MSKKTYTIGETARRAGLTARRVRFYDDAGLLRSQRSLAGYRVFDDADLVKLDLIGALREAGAGLETIRAVLGSEIQLRDVLEMRLSELEVRIRGQQRVAVTLRAALQSAEPTLDDLKRITAMINLSYAERRAIVASFFDSVTEGVHFDPEWKDVMIGLGAPELPEPASSEQIDAWLELNAMFDDERLYRSMRAQAIDTGRTLNLLRVRDERDSYFVRYNAIMDRIRQALESGAMPTSPQGQELADEYIAFIAWNRGLSDTPEFRSYIWDTMAHADTVRRFWQLVGTLNGQLDPESPAYRWIEEATVLRLNPC